MSDGSPCWSPWPPDRGYQVLLPDWGLLAMLPSLFLLVIAAALVLRRRSADRSGQPRGTSDTMVK